MPGENEHQDDINRENATLLGKLVAAQEGTVRQLTRIERSLHDAEQARQENEARNAARYDQLRADMSSLTARQIGAENLAEERHKANQQRFATLDGDVKALAGKVESNVAARNISKGRWLGIALVLSGAGAVLAAVNDLFPTETVGRLIEWIDQTLDK